jgi:hypothetical protein
MANYKELEGFGVQTLATDPDSPGWIGSIFYNSTSGTFKVVKPGGVSAGTWSSGGNLNTARQSPLLFGTQTAAILADGYSTAPSVATESYNGTAWTSVNNVIMLEMLPLWRCWNIYSWFSCSGDNYPSSPRDTAFTESWDGTNWTEVSDLNTARLGLAGMCGSQTAALGISGHQRSYIIYCCSKCRIMEWYFLDRSWRCKFS